MKNQNVNFRGQEKLPKKVSFNVNSKNFGTGVTSDITLTTVNAADGVWNGISY